MAAFVVVANLRVIHEAPRQIQVHNFPDIAATTADNLYAVLHELHHGPLPHIAGQHQPDALFAQRARDIRLTAATLGRLHDFGSDNLLLFVYLYNFKISAVTEMVIHAAISGWYGNFHLVRVFVRDYKDKQ